MAFNFQTGSNMSDPSYRHNSKLERTVDGLGSTTGFNLYYGDGSKEAFTKRGTYTWYMTERDDPARNKLSFVYTGLNTLDHSTDADGNTAYFYRTNTSWPTRITKISAPGSCDVNLFYDTSYG